MSGFNLGVPTQNISRRLSTIHRDDADDLPEESSHHLDELINKVSVEWSELLDEDANTLEVALSLMDNSSIGKAKYINRFEGLKTELQENLKLIVNNNYQGFNTSIGSYRNVVQSVSTTQNNINEVKELLNKARNELSVRRPVLKELKGTSLKYKQMIEILQDVEKLNAVPDQFELQISQKLFLSAYETLSNATVTANKETLQIPALDGMKGYLQNQGIELYSVLIEELHNHIYLKSPYTDNRWHAYRQGIDDFGSYEKVLEDKIRFDLSEKSTTFSEGSQLDSFLKEFDKEDPDKFVENHDENAESDSYYYIRLLVETLFKLNKLPTTFETLLQRLSGEIDKLMDKTIAEVSQRCPKNLGYNLSKDPYSSFEIGDNKMAALKDLIWTLYSKLIAVLEAHRIIYEVSKKISRQKLEAYNFMRVFERIESEIKVLLNSYIGNQKEPQEKKVHIVKTRYTLDKSVHPKPRKIFQFSDLEYDDIKSTYDELQTKFEKSVPGLVASSRDLKTNTFDPYLPKDVKVAHKLLIPANVFNIKVMLDPTVQFIQKASVITGTKKNVFVDSFLVNNFIPKLKESLIDIYGKVMKDGLEEVGLNWVKYSKLPILDGFIKFHEFVKKTSYLLNTTTVYRQHYTELVIYCIEMFTKQCNEAFESKVRYQTTTEDAKITNKRKIGAAWVLNPNLRKILEAGDDEEFIARRATQPDKKTIPITLNDLIGTSNIYIISTLSTSIQWLIVKLNELREDVEDAEIVVQEDLMTEMRKKWIMQDTSNLKNSDEYGVKIVLPPLLREKFETNIKILEALSKTCVLTLQADLKGRIIYYIDRTLLKESNYYLQDDTEEKDEHVLKMDMNIKKIDSILMETLVGKEKQRIYARIPEFVNTLLVKGAEGIMYMNDYGIKKMFKNIVIMQQMLKSVVETPEQVDFTRSVEYYKIVELTTIQVLEKVRKKEYQEEYGFDEMKNVLRLIRSKMERRYELIGRRDKVGFERNAYHEDVVKLREFF